ncbi:MAG: hypothetical protein ACKVQQ_01935 [Burkholderiales bacterium]
MKLPAPTCALPRSYQLALAALLVLVLVLRVAGVVGIGGALGLAMLAIFAVIQTAIWKRHIPFNYG